MAFSTVFFDLDDTIYPNSTGLWDAIRERMNHYMWERLNLPKEEVPFLRKTYFETYGTTLRGLQYHYGVDADEFLAYVHDLPLKSYIRPDKQVREMILSLPQHKWIFTNADIVHAHRVLSAVNLEDCFDGIVDIRATGFICKPEAEAYQLALSLAGETDPGRCILIDDSVRNLAPARQLGLFTIRVGSLESDPAAGLSIKTLSDLRTAMPELWSTDQIGETRWIK